MPLSDAQTSAIAHVQGAAVDLSKDCATIFSYGETAWREYRSAAWYVAKLRAEGVQRRRR